MTARAKILAALERDHRAQARRMAKLRNCAPAIFEQALETFENPLGAGQWLTAPVGLNGKAPVELLGTETGREEVRLQLARIDHGIPS